MTRASDGVTMIWLCSQILFDVIVLDWRNLIVEFLHLLWDYIYCCYMMVLNFLPLRLSCKESSTFSPSPSSSGSGDVTALRCSEPLRYKVDGASKPSPNCAGWDRLGITCYNLLELADWGCMGGGLLVETTIFVPHRSIALRLSPFEWGYFLTFCLLQVTTQHPYGHE